MNKFFISLCLMLYISGSRQPLLSQNLQCGLEWLVRQQDASMHSGISEANILLDSFIQKNGNQLGFRSDVVIPVVVHIIWSRAEENVSDVRVFSQIEALNRDFNGENEDLGDAPDEFKPFIARSGIRFCLAAVDPQGFPASGIIRKKTGISQIGTKDELFSTALGGSDAWDTERYLNIWVANTGEFLTGYGSYPGLVSPDRDGLVIHPKYFGENESKRYGLGRVAVHEAGHYFGLSHTWGNDEDCATDDGVEDTPLQLHPYEGCPAHPQVTCGSSDMFMNFMDYVDDGCMVMFTKGQMERMLATIELFRPGLRASDISCVNLRGGKPESPFWVFPNPADRELAIKFTKPTTEVGVVEVFNSFGQRVFKLKTVIFDGMKVELPELPSGIYWIRIGEESNKIMVR